MDILFVIVKDKMVITEIDDYIQSHRLKNLKGGNNKGLEFWAFCSFEKIIC